MKPTTSLFKKAVTLPFVCICLCGFGQATAQTITPVPNNSIDIEFVKADRDALVFDVHFYKLPLKGCVLSILDQAGEVLFETKIPASGYRQTYKIDRNNLSKITFEARGKDYHMQQSFNLRFIVEEKLEVTKLK